MPQPRMIVLYADRTNSLLTGTLDIGVTYSFSPMLAETLVEFMHLHPGVKLNVQYRTMDELMDRLSKREVDFVLAFKPTTPHEGIESHTLFDTRLAAVVRNNHPLAQQKSVTLHDLQRFSLALPAKGLQARSAFENIAGALPLDLNVNMEVNDVNILLKLVKSTSLVTLLAEATIYGDSEVKAVPIAAVGNEISGCVHLLRDVYRKRSALEFLRMLQQSPAIRARMEGWI